MARRDTRDVIVVGGAVAVLLFLFRGSGWGTGGDGGSAHAGDGGGWFAEPAKRSPLVIYVAEKSVRGAVYFVGFPPEATLAKATQYPATMEAAVAAAVRHAVAGGEVCVSAIGLARHGDVHAIRNRLVEMGVRFFENPCDRPPPR